MVESGARTGAVRLKNLQALRAVAALSVVIAHMANPEGFEQRWLAGNYSWLSPFDPAGNVGVDLFFVISGLIMVVTTSRTSSGTASAADFGYRRLVRIFPAYWVATLPVLALFLVAPGMVNSSQEHPPQILESLLLLPQPGLPLLLVGWTLTFELYFYLVFALSLLAPKPFRPVILLAWGVATVVCCLAFPETGNPWLALVSSPIALEFLFGAAVGCLVVRRLFIAPWVVAGAGVAAVVAALVLGGHLFPGTWYRVVPVGVLLAAVVYGLIGLEARDRLVAPRWLQTLGDASYSIYLYHVLFLGVLGRFVLARLPEGPVVHALALVFSLAVVIAGSLVAYRLIEKPLITLFRRRRPQVATDATPPLPTLEVESRPAS